MKSLLKALSQFQTECKPIVRTSNNPFFKSKYASLEDIQAHIRPYLVSSGLVVTQANIVVDSVPYVESRIWHVDSGESISSVFPVIVNKQSAQDYGSAVSYAKRYSVTGLLNVIIQDEDDDAQLSSKSIPTTFQELPELVVDKYNLMVQYISEGKIKEVETALKKYKLNDTQKKQLTTQINQFKSAAVTAAAKK